jgi:hypothetical protein
MFEFIQISPVEPTMNRPRLPVAIIAMLFFISAGMARAQVYKWTDASGQVHYGQKKPDDATQVQTLDIAPSPPAASATNADSAAEVARLNALSEKMARERQAAEQARQEQAIRDLEQANQQLKNDLLNQQLQQQKEKEKDDSDSVVFGYPPFYPYPYPRPYPSYPPKPHPPQPWPCEPWPACRQPPPPEPPRPGPLAKPNPTFQPAPARVAPTPKAFFRSP